jgi:Skp family chaperone for outer membrane proteins
MIKKISILVIVLLTQIVIAQKSQKVGYIDREYILENIPEYQTAQSKLDSKINNWNTSLNQMKSEIEALKLALSNERPLLTSDIITEREEDITIKETELKEKQEAYFGTSGDLFMLRKQLVKPVQDQIFNAIQEISTTKKYDIIFDKSSNDMVMLYSNPKYDVSELVLQKIVKGRKKKENEKKKSDNQIAREKKKESIKTKAKERKTKQEQLRDRIKKQNEAKAAKREALKKAAAERRAKKMAEAQARREALKNKGKKTEEGTTEGSSNPNSSKNKVAKTKAEERKEKQEQLKERIKKQNEAKVAKREALKKAAAEKRANKLAEIEARKEALKKKGKSTEKVEGSKKPTLINNSSDNTKTEEQTVSEKDAGEIEKISVKKTKEELRAEKIKMLQDRANTKKAKRDSLKKVAAEKRAKKLAEIEARKKKLEENKQKNN